MITPVTAAAFTVPRQPAYGVALAENVEAARVGPVAEAGPGVPTLSTAVELTYTAYPLSLRGPLHARTFADFRACLGVLSELLAHGYFVSLRAV